jgi:toxin-antitoxin system PIN domain toxin
MSGYLLDTNLLIALLWPSHTKHDAAVKWFAMHRAKGWATCPFTEAGFARIVSNPAFSRDAVQPREALRVLTANTTATDHVFWADDLPLADAAAFAEIRLVGHQQVTDCYLLGLAIRRGGILASFDAGVESLAEAKSAERKSLEIIREKS